MGLESSKRLRTLAGCVAPGTKTLADVGTDHGFLPILAVKTGRAQRAIACDVKPGPLARAAVHIREHGLEGRVETRLGSGLSVLSPGEADCAVFSGLGGRLMMELLAASPDALEGLEQLILQPQRDLPAVRRYVTENTPFAIRAERFVLEDGQGYFVLDCRKAGRSEKVAYTGRDCYLGKFLAQAGGVEYRKYIGLLVDKMKRILARQRGADSAAVSETAQKLVWLEDEYAACVLGHGEDGGAGPAGTDHPAG